MAVSFSLSPLDLFARLFAGTPPILLDIRVPDDVAKEEGWFPAAHRAAFDDLAGQLAIVPPDREVVVICQGGLKLSQGAAARLALRGCRAGYLAGGLVGWRAAGLPVSEAVPMLWVTDGRDIGAHWLATRLLPQPHEVLVVASDQVSLTADRFGGQPLSEAGELLARFDRVLMAVQSAIGFARSSEFERLTQGGAKGFDLLDAWTLGAEDLA